MSTTDVYVALLRGINVGGKNTIPMAALKSLFEASGFEDVATYIQSGNVVFRSAAIGEEEIAGHIEAQVAEVFGVESSVLLRTAAELEAVPERNPFLADGRDVSKLHVVFLRRAPAVDAAAELDPGRSPPDEFELRGREIYLYLPNGSGRSKLTIDYFERRLGAVATARNWNTLTKLRALARR